jgi:Uma2 family endonuclease
MGGFAMTVPIAQEEGILGPESAGLLMTPEEFDAIEDFNDHYRYELVEGVLIVSPIPLPEETGPNELLGRLLLNYQEAHPEGGALDYTLPQQYVFSVKSRRIADRLIWTGLRRFPNRKRDVPTIAVEFVSAGKRNQQRDYVDKRQEYLATGVREYWIFDRFHRTLTVIHNKPSKVREQVVAEQDTYTSPLLPGFVVPLARLLQAADQLAEILDLSENDARAPKPTRRPKPKQ